MARRTRVSFWARKQTSKPVKVSFRRSTGEKVLFKATKKISKPIKVSFYARRRRK